jgi:guanylate kinase
MQNAAAEMTHWHRYGYVLVSGAREEDARRFDAILEAGRMRTSLKD